MLRLAHDVGSAGRVTGIDVSRPMLAVAEARVRAASLANATLLRADAATHPFAPATVDLAFSRFGVMFFDDSVAAFANVRRALTSNGRLAFVCWRGLDENPWFYVPRNAVLPLVTPPPEADPNAPGPMAFADPDRVRRILMEAGYESVTVDPFDTRVTLGARERAVDFLLDIGPAARLLANADAATCAAAAERIDDAARAHETANGVTFGAALWLVRASRKTD